MHKLSLKCIQVDEDVHVSVTVTPLKETTISLQQNWLSKHLVLCRSGIDFIVEYSRLRRVRKNLVVKFTGLCWCFIRMI